MGCKYNLAGISRDCKNNLGGISAVLVANRDDLILDNPDAGATVEFKDWGSVGKSVLRFIPGSNSTFTSTATVDKSAGTNYIENSIQLQFNKQSVGVANALNRMMAGDDLIFIIRDNNGEIYIVGYEEGCYMSDGTAQTGTARSDGNFYQITFKNVESDFPLIIDQSNKKNENILIYIKTAMDY